jgi:hypothetical protein
VIIIETPVPSFRAMLLEPHVFDVACIWKTILLDHTHTHTHTHTHVASGHLTSTLQKLTMRVMCTLMLRDVKSLTLPCDSISKTLIYSPLE